MENPKIKAILLTLAFIFLFATALLVGAMWRQYQKVALPLEEILGLAVAETPHTTAPSVAPSVESTASNELVQVAKVIDGDTIVLENKTTVRYIGIDTPETVDPRRPVGCFGREASRVNKELVEGKIVRLEKDISETDKYGRLLRYVFLPTDTGEVFVNDYLVRQGFAKAYTYPPDLEYQQQFLEAQQAAMENNIGLWGVCQ